MSSAQEEVSKEWNAMAGEWDDLAASYRDGFVNVLWERTGLTPDSLVVVDFGCGTGLLTESLQNKASKVICIDAAPLMIRQVQGKIRAREWKHVEAHCAALAHLHQSPESVQEDLKEMNGKVDLVVASSVFSVIPKQDISHTMKAIGELLRPGGGVLCHSDWPKTDENPDGMIEESATKLYEMAGLEKQSTIVSMNIMGEEHPVFVGVAVKR